MSRQSNRLWLTAVTTVCQSYRERGRFWLLHWIIEAFPGEGGDLPHKPRFSGLLLCVAGPVGSPCLGWQSQQRPRGAFCSDRIVCRCHQWIAGHPLSLAGFVLNMLRYQLTASQCYQVFANFCSSLYRTVVALCLSACISEIGPITWHVNWKTLWWIERV